MPNWPVRAAGTAKDYFATAKDWQAVEKQKSPSNRGMFVIPGRPVPAARPRVTSRGVYYNKRYRDWLDAAKVYARQWALGLPLIEGPVTLSVDFYGARNADSDNLLKGVMDALTGTVIKDDSQISEIVVKRWPVSKGDESFCRQDPRTEVRILA